MQQRRRRARPLPLLPLLLLLLGPAGTGAADIDSGECERPWLDAVAQHGRLAARACPSSGAIEVTLESSRNKPLAIPLAAVGFRYRGRWLSAGRGGGLVLEGVEVSEEVGVVLEEEEEDGVSSTAPASASAALGPSTLLSVQWRAESEEGAEQEHRRPAPRFHTNVRVYHQHAAVAFEQVFPLGTQGADTGDQDRVISSFPAFAVADWADRGFLTYAHNMACPDGLLFCTPAGAFNDPAGLQTLAASCGQAGGVPLVVFDRPSSNSNSSQAAAAAAPGAFVLSPMDNFMAANVFLDLGVEDGGALQYGVQGKVDALPAGFALSTLLYAHVSPADAPETPKAVPAPINAAMAGWGALLRRVYGKADAMRAALRAGDVTAEYLSYYTDNGAFYYYNTEGNKTYEQTLLELWEYAQREGLPYRALQLDSWWYYKGRDGGVSQWAARPDVFPSGLRAFHRQLGDGAVPLIAHNRWWSVDAKDAAQNGGDYDFLVEKRGEPPLSLLPEEESTATALAARRRRRRHLSIDDDMDPLPHGAALPLEQRFWDDLFAEGKRWGLYTYEQDWLHNTFLSLNATLASTDVAQRWLRQMGRAAVQAGVRIQYCMAFPRFYLQALAIPAVTQIRASDDYGPGLRADQWALGDTALLAHSLGLVPFKDVFWSNTTQPGNPYSPQTQEGKPALEAAIATLSGGPVAPGDRMGLEDKELILRACRADGRLLKPSRPLTTIDAVHARRAFGGGDEQGPEGMVMATYALLPFASAAASCSALRFDIVLAAALEAPFALRPHHLISPPGPSHDETCQRFLEYVAFPSPFSDGHRPAQLPTTVPLTAFTPGAAANASALPLGPCGRQDFALWHTAPVLPLPVLRYRSTRPKHLLRRGQQQQHQWESEEEEEGDGSEAYGGPWVRRAGLVLLGERSKWVPHSPQRFAGAKFSARHTALLVSVVGAPGERVALAAAAWEGQKEVNANVTEMLCDVGVDGRADLSVWLVEGGGGEREEEKGPAEVAWVCQGRIEEE